MALIEQTTGNDVAILDVGADEHGFTMRDQARGAVFIAVARTKNPMRQRSSLAHELAHVVFEDWADDPHTSADERPHHEVRADAFARHLLVPVEGVKEVIGEHPASLEELSRIVQLFEVSPPIAAIAMEQAGCIDAGVKSDWMSMNTAHLAARYGWGDQYEALRAQSDRRRAPQKLLKKAIDGYMEHLVSAETLATLRGVDVDEVVRGLSEEGITPRACEVEWAAADDLPAVEVDFSDWEDDAEDEDLGE
ncbi:ImmA/IrrE family metallo-endopeptidase [Prescottella equi]|uniref:ImmA/IrrE family metallo-endopeptidase n=1 Tax=Rhodococcus hoagii TaxID=43767 RepID=UPI00191C84F3|nr:ImmA/IrrE family metallo-endopeptidase [Prescottella equi]